MQTQWCCQGARPVVPGRPFGIMGIVNTSPDSFYQDTASGLTKALRLRAEGATILDLGGESTRPGSRGISPEEECHRLLPVLSALRAQAHGTLLSVDTWHASTAATVLRLGVDIINDVSAASWDPALVDVLVQFKPGYVLMHALGRPETMQVSPHYENVVDEVLHFFETQMQRLVSAGLPENRIILDPGIGFGKTLKHNLDLLTHIQRISTLGRPLLIGISMKQVFGDLLGLPVEQRCQATQIATALLFAQGVLWHRVHHVAETVQTLTLASHLRMQI